MVADMADSAIRTKSFEFALKIIRLSNRLQQQREYVISNQLVRAGTSIGANCRRSTSGAEAKGLSFKDGGGVEGGS